MASVVFRSSITTARWTADTRRLIATLISCAAFVLLYGGFSWLLAFPDMVEVHLKVEDPSARMVKFAGRVFGPYSDSIWLMVPGGPSDLVVERQSGIERVKIALAPGAKNVLTIVPPEEGSLRISRLDAVTQLSIPRGKEYAPVPDDQAL